MDYYIFGAKATAAGLYKALLKKEPEDKLKAFLVSDTKENADEIFGIPVRSLSEEAALLSDEEKQKIKIYAAVPELIHPDIKELLQSNGFKNPIMLDSKMEADLMEKYFESEGKFRSVRSLELKNKKEEIPNITFYAASFYKDKPLNNPPKFPDYIKRLYLGCDGAVKNGIDIKGQADFYDNEGDNISEKNPNRCEMTAHYWVWKNRLNTDDDYVGICHYRRLLDLSDDDLRKIKENEVDAVLPFPMIHYPNAEIQHSWYVKEKDWNTLKKVVQKLYPDYGRVFDKVFKAHEFYNYNMLLAKKSVFADYCAWLYPILDRIEEISEPKGADRHDRYTAYMSESLTTLYFMANLNDLKIYHTGRLLFR